MADGITTRLDWFGDQAVRKIVDKLDGDVDRFRRGTEAHIKKSISGPSPSPADGRSPPGKDTGELLLSIISSIRRTAKDIVVIVGSTVPTRSDQRFPYPHHLEFGTSIMKPRPWLRPAVDSLLPSLLRDFGRKL